VRQLYACDTSLSPEAPLFFLEEGAAAAARPACHDGRLICPYPGCETPRYSTRGGQRRDHFFHVNAPAVSHNPESFHHYCAKHLVGSWVRGKYPEARVQVDQEAVENGQVPDVIVKMPNGVRYAFEIQYSPITLDEWQRRHDGYRSQGVVDIWLWGHVGVHGRRHEGRLRFSDLHASVERQTHLIRWIDPEERVLYASPNYTGRGHEWVPRVGYTVLPRRETLDSLALDAKGLVSPLLLQERAAYRNMLEQQRQEKEAEQARLRQEKEAEQRRLRQEKKATLLRRAWLARPEEERARWNAARDARYAGEWKHLRAHLEKRYGGLPEVIYAYHRSERFVNALPAFWHATVMSKVLEGRISRTSKFGHCYHAVEDRMPKQSALGFEALLDYLAILASHGYIAWEEPVDGRPVFRVLHDLTHPPEGQPYADDADGARRQVTSDGEIVSLSPGYWWWSEGPFPGGSRTA
jgi:hypothetical protein